MKNAITCVLVMIISISCTLQSQLKDDIDRIAEINSTVKNYKTEILNKCRKGEVSVSDESMSNNMEHYTVSYLLETSDTTIAIVYMCMEYDNNKIYRDCTVAKQYNKGNLKHEVCLFNDDTLYHYTTNLFGEAPRFFIDYKFIVGKYYYMFMCNNGLLSEGQSIYFMQHIDSLIKVRGNCLPELPGIDTISLKEFREKGMMQKVFDENPFL